MKTAAIIIFIVMYALMVLLPKWRYLVALMVPTAIDWNVLMMIFGTMVIVDYFIESKMPEKIADALLRLCPNVMWVTIIMSLFSGIVSAFIDNVATVLMIAWPSARS